MQKTWAFLLLLLLTLGAQWVYAAPVPRVVVALYDSSKSNFRFSRVHQFVEMPLNHLGLIIRPHDLKQGLPDLSNQPEVRGVLTWFGPGYKMDRPLEYLEWGRKLLRQGKRFVIIGESGFRSENSSEVKRTMAITRFFEEMGIQELDEWVELTYNHRFVYEDPSLTKYERKEFRVKPPFDRIAPLSPLVTSHLIIQRGEDLNSRSHLIMTGPKGGYIAEGYAMFYNLELDQAVRQWYINPFEFFRLALGTDDLPKPDSNTLAGSRIFYSHIDGDGWNNVTYLEDYKDQQVFSSQVIYGRVLKRFQDMPVSVSAIAAELDPKWAGKPQSVKVAKEIFALPNVEIGSHTYSHPFQWSFFESGDPEKERPYLSRYKGGGWGKGKVVNRMLAFFYKGDEKNIYKEGSGLIDDYDVPRAYANQPFDLDLEIGGSVAFLEGLAPPGKKAKILMWSGNTSPFEAALVKTRTAGLENINGGDSRMDSKYPSYAWVAPVGRIVGKERQIYSSNSNENTYTDLWTGGFHGFRFLANTVFNTEQPIRVKPFNIYYHMYSGERQASYLALMENIELARKERLTRIWASQFAQIAQGFYSVELEPMQKEQWKVLHRGALQTLRFDQGSGKTVDYRRSKGVIGHNYFQGCLYVYLDQTEPEPVVGLGNFRYRFAPQTGEEASLDWSTWEVSGLERGSLTQRFFTRGFGPGKQRWRLDPRRNWVAERKDKKSLEFQYQDGWMTLQIPQSLEPIEIGFRATL